jgi:hypothetical protein
VDNALHDRPFDRVKRMRSHFGIDHAKAFRRNLIGCQQRCTPGV